MIRLDQSLKDPLFRVISLGLGVQSTTLALMAKHGEIDPMPDFAMFADTRAEPLEVYEHLRFMRGDNIRLPFPIEVVSKGSLRDDTKASAASWQSFSSEQRNDRSLWKMATRVANPPFFTRGPRIRSKTVTLSSLPLFGVDEEEIPHEVEFETEDESFGFLGRKCTRDYKIEPMVAMIRDMIGLEPGQPGPNRPVVEQWIGISTDEKLRLKESDVPYIQHRWPLIEKRMSRADCYAWLRRHGYPIPPKSRCVFCPFQSDALWREMKETQPEDFEAACLFDEAIRDGVRGTLHRLYLHARRIPLREVDFSGSEDAPMMTGFVNECAGVCGV